MSRAYLIRRINNAFIVRTSEAGFSELRGIVDAENLDGVDFDTVLSPFDDMKNAEEVK